MVARLRRNALSEPCLADGSVAVAPEHVYLTVVVMSAQQYREGMSDKERAYAEVIRAQGAESLGIQHWGPEGGLVLFTDPMSWTTLAVYELEFSPHAVSQRLQTSRRAFSSSSHIPESPC